MKWMVLTKEPKVHSTAIRQMREEIKKIQLILSILKKMNKKRKALIMSELITKVL